MNLDLVRSIYERWERGDFSWVGWADPEIEYVIVDGPAPGNWTGLAGLEQGGLGFLSSWDELRVRADECHELDDERVLVLTRLSGRGKTSGMELGEMQAQGADLLQVRDGKVTRFVLYFNRERALAELGTSPE
jgi:ketosteroid isomerase-like protein